MAEVKIGWALEKIEIGDIAADGGMGTTLTEFGYTELDSLSFVEDEGTEQDFRIEEEDIEIWIAQTVDGAKNLSWRTNDITPEHIALVKGGTAGGDGTTTPLTYAFPTTETFPEQSVKITLRTGQFIDIPRVRLKARFDWQIGKGAIAACAIMGRILKPTKADTPPLTITTPLPE